MPRPRPEEPPPFIWYNLDQALELLAVLEDARDALLQSRHLTMVLSIENEVKDLSRRLDLHDEGGSTDVD